MIGNCGKLEKFVTRKRPDTERRVLAVLHSESDGRPEWIRTIDLFRVKEAL